MFEEICLNKLYKNEDKNECGLYAYDKSCFKFIDHFLRVSFKYKENPFEYDSKNKVSIDDTINDTLNGTIKLTKNEQQIYSLTTNGKYKYLSRIDNTLVYIDVAESYKDVVKDIMKEIGY